LTEQYKNIIIEKNSNHPKIPSTKFYLGSFGSMVVGPSDEWQYVCFDNVQYWSLLLIYKFVIKSIASKNLINNELFNWIINRLWIDWTI